jgi:protein FAM32A
MPGDEYAAVGGGGALKLKGAKVTKKKKKSAKAKADLERAAEGALVKREDSPRGGDDDDDDRQEKRIKKTSKGKRREGDEVKGEDNDEEGREPTQQTESERQFEETRRKRVSLPLILKDLCARAGVCVCVCTEVLIVFLLRHSCYRWWSRIPSYSSRTESVSRTGTSTSRGSRSTTTCPRLDLAKTIPLISKALFGRRRHVCSACWVGLSG